MTVENSARINFDNINVEILSPTLNREAKIEEIKRNGFEFINQNSANNMKNSRFVPIKLTREEILRAHEYQKTMLNFVFMRYKASIGTPEEEFMKKFYNDALVDYDDFVALYRDDLL